MEAEFENDRQLLISENHGRQKTMRFYGAVSRTSTVVPISIEREFPQQKHVLKRLLPALVSLL